MEGYGAIASVSLSSNLKSTKPSEGCLVNILVQSKTGLDFDWDLMKTVETCSDKSFMKMAPHAKRIDEFDSEIVDIINNPKNLESKFIFDENLFKDAVVVPFYRHSDLQPQFYCVTAIEHSSTPLSPFPVSSHSHSTNYGTFYQYFVLKYNILISNIDQPLLVVSHPSTRLNLLTPRYMNMKANVLQKSYFNHSSKSEKKSGNKIFLVPELVNVHPLAATVWRRCMCLPSILYRLNCLLVAEELRREIAQASGVGVPWSCGQPEKLSFEWDADKEIEVSNVPDYELDLAGVNQQNSQQEELDDPKWNFEISEWNNDFFKETKSKEKMAGLNMPELSGEKKAINGWDEVNSKTLFIDPTDMAFFAGNYEFSFKTLISALNFVKLKDALIPRLR